MGSSEKYSIARMEEIASSVSHGIGLLAVLISAPFLILAAVRHTAAVTEFGAGIFLASTALLYMASTCYHGLPHGYAKRFFLKLDHSAIFLLIAGSYTAFVCTLPSSASGWLLGLVWGIAALGLVLKLCDKLSHPLHSTAFYFAMGWLTLIAILPMAEQLPAFRLYWLIAGALAYSSGVAVYLLGTRLCFSHLGWHLLVMTGSGCHFVALLRIH